MKTVADLTAANDVNLTGPMALEEKWKCIPGWEPYYEVSTLGRVRSFDYRFTSGKGARQFIPAGPVATWVTPNGYTSVSLHRNGARWAVGVHRLILLAFVGPAADGMHSRHLDGDKSNNTLGNLSWGTPSENGFDTIRHGRHWQLSKTHCPQGHPYDEANTRYRSNGHRVCRTCDQARCRARYARAKSRNGGSLKIWKATR